MSTIEIMLTLHAEKRDGKVKPKALRGIGKVPAVFYGRKEQSTPIAVSMNEFSKVLREAGESTVISLSYLGKDIQVLVHDVAYDPMRNEPIHIDFYAIEADKPVEVEVPLEFVGVSPAVKDLGGVLVKVLHEVEISALPKDLPHAIEINISALAALESRILVRDLKLPQGVTVMNELGEVIALVTTQTQEKEEETPTTFDATQVEVEKKGKEEEAGVVEVSEETGGGKEKK